MRRDKGIELRSMNPWYIHRGTEPYRTACALPRLDKIGSQFEHNAHCQVVEKEASCERQFGLLHSSPSALPSAHLSVLFAMAKNFGPTFLAWCLTLGIALGSPIGLSNYPVKRDYAVFESANVPPVWNQASRAPSSHLLDMKIGLKQKAGHDEIAQHLYEISDPSHARYGQHFTLDEVNELITPLEESIEAVREWLAENGIHPHQYTESPARDWVSFSIPVQHAESLLDTEYSVYKHGETGEHLIRTDRYSLPLELHNHIDLVAPSIYFGAITAQKAILHAQAAVTAPIFTPRSNGNVTGCQSFLWVDVQTSVNGADFA